MPDVLLVLASHRFEDPLMCGRFAQKRPVSDYARFFRTKSPPIDWSPRYNLSPGQQALVLLTTAPGRSPEITSCLWGLIPHWAKERSSYSTINARIESIAEKPTYRDSFRHRRCIIPADGYYEWTGVTGSKTPWYFRKPDDKPFALAGLWDTWTDPMDPAKLPMVSFTIIVRPATPDIRPIHDRMPAIIPEDMWEKWLRTNSSTDLDSMAVRLQKDPQGVIFWYPVTKRVNSSRIDTPDLITPLPFDIGST